MPVSLNEADVLKLAALLTNFLASSPMTRPAKMKKDKWIAEQRIILECLAFEFDRAFGQEMRRLRVQYKLEPKDLAKMLGVSPNWLRGLESGFRSTSLPQKVLVADIFDQNLLTMILRVLKKCLEDRDTRKR